MVKTNLRQCWQIAHADTVTRIRRKRLFILATVCLYLGHVITVGDLQLLFNDQNTSIRYRGIHNAVWIGTVMALVTAGSVILFGFYVVNDAISNDRRDGPNKLIASSNINSTTYLFGKWLGNFLTLLILVGFIVISVIALFIFRGEGSLNIFDLLTPFILLTTPTVALVASIAVLFDSIGPLRGTLGGVIYFFGVLFVIYQDLVHIDPASFSIVFDSIRSSIHAQYPEFAESGFAFSSSSSGEIKAFTWNGYHISVQLITNWLVYVLASCIIVVLSVVPFDRFDPSAKSYQFPSFPISRDSSEEPQNSDESSPQKHVTIDSLSHSDTSFNPIQLIIVESKIILRGQSLVWYVGCIGLILVGAFTGGSSLILSIAWIWPLFVWSHLGVREQRNNVDSIIFTSRYPVLQLGAAWVAAAFITLVIVSGPLLARVMAGTGVFAIIAGVVFVPSLGLVCGLLSKTPRLFEISYMILWYIGVMNQEQALDFGGASDTPVVTSITFTLIGIALLIIGLLYRRRMSR